MSALDPELERVARRGRAANIPLNRFTLALIRLAMRAMRGPSRFDGVRVENRFIAGRDARRKLRHGSTHD